MSIYAINHQNPKFIFIINYKVMYSSLYAMLTKNFPEITFLHKSQISGINFHAYTKYGIVRNPYDRALSVFYDKCRKAPAAQIDRESTQLEYCQAQLLNMLQKVRECHIDIVRPAQLYTQGDPSVERKLLESNLQLLTTIQFDEFINCLSEILRLDDPDGHFQIQYKAYINKGQNLFFYPSKVFKNTRIFKLEKIKEYWPDICSSLGKKMALKKANRTDHMRPSSDEMYTKKRLI